MRIVDLNVLLYAVNSDAAQHDHVREKDDHWETLKSLLRDTSTAGNLTTDAHLAALALSHDAVLVSCDGDFARFKGLRWEHPLG